MFVKSLILGKEWCSVSIKMFTLGLTIYSVFGSFLVKERKGRERKVREKKRMEEKGKKP